MPLEGLEIVYTGVVLEAVLASVIVTLPGRGLSVVALTTTVVVATGIEVLIGVAFADSGGGGCIVGCVVLLEGVWKVTVSPVDA